MDQPEISARVVAMNFRHILIQRKRRTATATELLDGRGSGGGAKAGSVDVPGQQVGDAV